MKKKYHKLYHQYHGNNNGNNKHNPVLSHVLYYMVGGLFSITTLSTIALLSNSVLATNNDNSVSFSASISVPASCSFTGGGASRFATITNGNTDIVTGDPITTSCNDIAGYAIYAIGYSSDSYTAADRTDMIASIGSSWQYHSSL